MQLSAKTLEAQLEKVRELEGRLTFRLSVLSKLVDQHATELLKDTSLSLSSYRILTVVSTFSEISISDISRFNAIDRAQVSRTAVELQKQGLVEFRTDPDSKRKKIVVLADEGRRLLEHISPRFEARRDAIREAMGPEAHAALWQGMEGLYDAITS